MVLDASKLSVIPMWLLLWPRAGSSNILRCMPTVSSHNPQVMVPGTPKLSLTTVWSLPYDPKSEWAPETPFVRSLQAFLDGDNTERGNIFKLIPR